MIHQLVTTFASSLSQAWPLPPTEQEMGTERFKWFGRFVELSDVPPTLVVSLKDSPGLLIIV